MARPKANELTTRELDVMHVFWKSGEITPAMARDHLALQGTDLAYTTVATLVRILADKGFLKKTNDERPYRYRPVRTYEEVSGSMLGDMLDKVFGGSSEQLLVRLFDKRKLSAKERALLREILKDQSS